MSIVFADRGLHLGVLDALLNAGALDPAALVTIVESTGPDGPEDGYPGPGPRLAASLTLLHAFGITEAQAAAVEAVDFDGGNEIYMLVEQTLDIDTGGESDDYIVASLAGERQLPGLRSLDLDGHGYRSAALDLTPLAGHPTLEKLLLTGDATAAATLESLPALRDLDVSLAGNLDDPDVLNRLENRGVAVRRRGR
ncbi:DUF6892 domain-containing protein [Actinoplanes couchii]|uniref:DUF6892 domain-containing protein n=1 Tax=Actinoplanes couchii TaxID=403638 RepID=A0ABQ3XMX7_9ACTN|nr:hypothetical protein [Actinoplanes couchii]MDR6317864.1 hypothetical protein [Actinoplanes couchii]GID59851.1 hypothetical protein Aco03nite_082550 [Actinoplanes couchii]